MSTTHEVFNQVTPLADVNLFSGNAALRDAVRFNAPQLDVAALVELGAMAGSADMQVHARLANHVKPALKTHDSVGRRIDAVEFHPSYHALLGAAVERGLAGVPWARPAGGHVERAAGFMLFTELEPSVLCPVSMTYAVAPALRANAGLWADWGAKLTAGRYDPRALPVTQKTGVTMGMGMTEKQGGSDVRANTTRAEFVGDDDWGRRAHITGHKWFLSAPMCDAFLVLAQSPGGLSCFLVPRVLRDGSANALCLQRLKDKLGNWANASSEVEFDAAQGWLVGEEGRGVPQILAMGSLTRLDCALGTAGLMRQALSLALNHTAQREAFGKRLIAQPLMQAVLADLALESEAATALALRLARAIDRSEQGDADETALRRLLTPPTKFWVCKRGSHFAQEAMECLGGNGYVEDDCAGVMTRVYREMPLNSIWEGSGNIMAIDLLRALRGVAADEILRAEVAPALGRNASLDHAAERLFSLLADAPEEAQARGLARDLALVMQGALLAQHSPEWVFDAFCRTRLAASSDVFGVLPAQVDAKALVERASLTAA